MQWAWVHSATPPMPQLRRLRFPCILPRQVHGSVREDLTGAGADLQLVQLALLHPEQGGLGLQGLGGQGQHRIHSQTLHLSRSKLRGQQPLLLLPPRSILRSRLMLQAPVMQLLVLTGASRQMQIL